MNRLERCLFCCGADCYVISNQRGEYQAFCRDCKAAGSVETNERLAIAAWGFPETKIIKEIEKLKGRFEYEIDLDDFVNAKWHIESSGEHYQFWAGANRYSPYEPPSRYEYGKPLEPEHPASIDELCVFCGRQDITDILIDGDFQDVEEYVIEQIAGV